MRFGSPSAVVAAQPTQWGTFLKQFAALPPFYEKFQEQWRPVQSTKAGPGRETALTRAQILQVVRDTAAGVSGDGSVADDAPLMQAGIDSLGAVELRNRLVAQLGVKLPNTLTFDYPTIAAVAGFIAEQVAPAEAPTAALRAEVLVNESVAILGIGRTKL